MQTFINLWGSVIWTGFGQTLAMTSITFILSVVIGIPIGVLLVVTRIDGLHPNKPVYSITNWIINILRSLPFIILLFLILPITKFVAGTTIGIRGVVLPLVVYAGPYIGRLVESSLLEVDPGTIEAYQSMGISNGNIIWRIMVRESRSSIIRGLTIAAIGLIGATAMAGLVGAGGLGDIAYQYGFQRYQPDVMYVTIVILIVLVQLIQSIGNVVSARLKKD
ncbi:methionine ABC transporter permease [Paucilactobacillus kaifaensis]|uniref:methionine ABC transporter permease n=1 Tax=Paucilactobacillus kaifaensis TaxID=2559921 RepID=UPI0010F54497|nr:methionine ABC transporter permease [Paucilactobacillus kaifaensis]